jgi:hypothetical protein
MCRYCEEEKKDRIKHQIKVMEKKLDDVTTEIESLRIFLNKNIQDKEIKKMIRAKFNDIHQILLREGL